MDATFDVQRDHGPLLRAVARLLAPGGVLIFSNNNRRFKMDREALPELQIGKSPGRPSPGTSSAIRAFTTAGESLFPPGIDLGHVLTPPA
jgi:hypothetical protein